MTPPACSTTRDHHPKQPFRGLRRPTGKPVTWLPGALADSAVLDCLGLSSQVTFRRGSSQRGRSHLEPSPHGCRLSDLGLDSGDQRFGGGYSTLRSLTPIEPAGWPERPRRAPSSLALRPGPPRQIEPGRFRLRSARDPPCGSSRGRRFRLFCPASHRASYLGHSHNTTLALWCQRPAVRRVAIPMHP